MGHTSSYRQKKQRVGKGVESAVPVLEDQSRRGYISEINRSLGHFGPPHRFLLAGLSAYVEFWYQAPILWIGRHFWAPYIALYNRTELAELGPWRERYLINGYYYYWYVFICICIKFIYRLFLFDFYTFLCIYIVVDGFLISEVFSYEMNCCCIL